MIASQDPLHLVRKWLKGTYKGHWARVLLNLLLMKRTRALALFLQACIHTARRHTGASQDTGAFIRQGWRRRWETFNKNLIFEILLTITYITGSDNENTHACHLGRQEEGQLKVNTELRSSTMGAGPGPHLEPCQGEDI